MPRPLCVKCQVEYEPERNDITVEQVSRGGSYRLWCADLFECPQCGHRIVVGYGDRPYAEIGEPEYRFKLEQAKARGEVYVSRQCLRDKDRPRLVFNGIQPS